jgi:hypothetical protein
MKASQDFAETPMRFPLQPLMPQSRMWLAGVTGGCVALALIGFACLSFTPATATVSMIVCATMIMLAAFFAWIGAGVDRADVSVENDQVVLSMPLYGRSIDLARIDSASVAKVDLAEAHALKPTWRTNGLSVAGLTLVWFRTRGAGKALMAMTGTDAVTWTTQDGYAVVVSVRDGDGLMRAMKAAMAR